jgi:DNA-binding transcriptional LysR family regulator
MVNPLHLRTLVAVLQTSSFAVAARQLGYTPSAVSQQIAALERATHLMLFERDARSIRPTTAAMFLAARGQEVLAALGTLEDELRELADGSRGAVRLGSFPTASEHLLPTALANLASTHPAVDVVLDEGEPVELTPRVQDGELDAALVYRYTRVPSRQPRTLTYTPLLREDLYLVTQNERGHAAGDPIGLEGLAEAAWVTTRPGTEGATCLQRLCADAGFEPHIAHRSNDYDVIRGFVRCGLGIAMVPALGYTPEPGLTAVRATGTAAFRRVGLLTRNDGHSPAVRALLAALATAARALRDPNRGVNLDTEAPRRKEGLSVGAHSVSDSLVLVPPTPPGLPP